MPEEKTSKNEDRIKDRLFTDAEKKDIYFKAYRGWGIELQVNMLIEEMAELTQAIMKARRNGIQFTYSVYEELADVEIMVEQIKLILQQLPATLGTEKNLYQYVENIKADKLERLKEMVETL